jgi:hypothetical protein
LELQTSVDSVGTKSLALNHALDSMTLVDHASELVKSAFVAVVHDTTRLLNSVYAAFDLMSVYASAFEAREPDSRSVFGVFGVMDRRREFRGSVRRKR